MRICILHSILTSFLLCAACENWLTVYGDIHAQFHDLGELFRIGKGINGDNSVHMLVFLHSYSAPHL